MSLLLMLWIYKLHTNPFYNIGFDVYWQLLSIHFFIMWMWSFRFLIHIHEKKKFGIHVIQTLVLWVTDQWLVYCRKFSCNKYVKLCINIVIDNLLQGFVWFHNLKELLYSKYSLTLYVCLVFISKKNICEIFKKWNFSEILVRN